MLVLAVGVWSFWIEPGWLQTIYYEIHTAKLDHPIRLEIIADLQTDRIGSHEQRAPQAVAAAKPDLVLLTGDYLQVESRFLARETFRLQTLWRQVALRAPLGVWAVGGDVEGPNWPEIFAGLPVRPLENSTTFEVGQLTLSALSAVDSRSGHFPITASERFHIAFGHAPDFALSRPSVDLMVAGHTHGGQVRLPLIGPLLTFSRIPRAWAAGRTDFDDGRTLVVSRGIGMERGNAPRLRFLCRPEVVLIDLLPAS